MSSIVISGDTSGTVSLTVPALAGTNTATLPAATGTVMVSGNMPAFSAYIGTNQTISNVTTTKVQFNTKAFDTANCFDNTTNYRFTPNVAGYYQVIVWTNFGVASGIVALNISKNGTRISAGDTSNSTSAGLVFRNTALVYMNGTTDYLESYVYQNSGGNLTMTASADASGFQAVLVRAA